MNRTGNSKTKTFEDADHQIVESPDHNAEEDESTDKETRLTLMEEVLLLGLKDREVCINPFAAPLLLYQAFLNSRSLIQRVLGEANC